MEDHGLWKEVLDSKYGSWRNLGETNLPRNASRWWKDIYKACGNSEQGNWFEKCIEWNVGERNRVKFWEDV